MLASINLMQDRAVQDSFLIGQRVVEEGFRANEREGTPMGRSQALLDLEATFHSVWMPITDYIEVSWP